MPRFEKNKIIYDQEDFLRGYAPQGGTNQGATVIAGEGYGWGQNIHINRMLGFLVPGAAAETPTNDSVVTDNLVSLATFSSTQDYMISDDGKLFKFTYSTNTVVNDGTFPHTIDHAHSTESGSDVILYRHNSSSSLVTSLFYSFRDATDWDVGCYLNQTTFDDNYMSTVPASPLAGSDLTYGKDYPHPMIIGADGNLYIGSGRYLHCLEGTNGADGTFVANVLTLPSNFVITCFEKSGTLLIIGGFYTVSDAFTPDGGSAAMFVWNYLDQTISEEIPIDDNYLASLFLWNGKISGITYGETGIRGRTRVRQLLGSEFVQVAEINAEYPNAKGAVDFVGKQLLVNARGVVYAIGMPYDETGYEVSQPYTVTGDAAKGILVNHGTSGIFASASGTPYKYLNNYATATFEAQTVFPAFMGYNKARVKGITVYFRSTFTGGRSFIGSFTCDDGLITWCSETVLSGDKVKKYLKDTSNAPFPDFTSLRLALDWGTGSGATAAAIVQRVEIEIEPITI